MLTFKQLTTPVTEAQALATIINWLDALKFGATSWQPGSVQLTLLSIVARLWAQLTEMVATLVKAGFNSTAEGEWLTRFSRSNYGHEREPSVAARHRIQFTCSANAGPYTPTAGSIVVADAERTYRLVQDTTYPIVTIPRGGTVYMVCEAEVPGKAGNAAANTITRMVRTYAGVTCSNPPISGGVSYITEGLDEETDERLRLRNQTRWANLSLEVTVDGCIYTALNASSYVQKVHVDDTNPRGEFTVDVYVFGAGAPVDVGPLALVQAALDKRFIGNDYDDDLKRALAVAAEAYTLVTGGTVYCAPGTAASSKEAVEAALNDLVERAPIGGYDYTPGPRNVITRNDIIAAIEGAAGVRYCNLTTPAANLTIPANQGIAPPASWGFNYVETTAA